MGKEKTIIGEKKVPNFYPGIFRDVDKNTLDFQKDKFYVINKVLNFGMEKDVTELISYYGKDEIKKQVVDCQYHYPSTVSFLCLLLDLNSKDFICYTQRQSSPKLWIS